MIPVTEREANSADNAECAAEIAQKKPYMDSAHARNSVRRADAMRGHLGGKNGLHPIQKLMRRMRAICLAVSAARPDLSAYLPALILAGMAACQSWQKQVASVVCEYYKDRIYLPRWRDLPTPVQFAYVLAAALNGQGREQGYTAISLNLTMRLAAMSPVDLVDLIRKRLQRALGTNIIFTIELDAAGRAHVHAVYFGNLTPTQRKRLKQAGGEWGGSDSRRQLVCKEKGLFNNALGWTEYMQKGGVLYIPRDMRRAGQASYEQIRVHVTKVRTTPTPQIIDILTSRNDETTGNQKMPHQTMQEPSEDRNPTDGSQKHMESHTEPLCTHDEQERQLAELAALFPPDAPTAPPRQKPQGNDSGSLSCRSLADDCPDIDADGCGEEQGRT